MRTASLVLVLFLAPALAHADIPPPEGYVETCVASYYAQPGVRCGECSTNHTDIPCAGRAALEGMQLCCRTAGASVWTEIWCEGTCPEPDLPEAVAAPQQRSGGGCSAGGGAVGAWRSLAFAALLLLRSRR